MLDEVSRYDVEDVHVPHVHVFGCAHFDELQISGRPSNGKKPLSTGASIEGFPFSVFREDERSHVP